MARIGKKAAMAAKVEALIIRSNEREILWEALETITKAATGGNLALLAKEIESAKKLVVEYARCSCGRPASMYGHGGYGRVCETCLST